MVAITSSSRREQPRTSWLTWIFRGSVITAAVVGGMVLGEMLSFNNSNNDNFLVSETVFYTPGLRTDAFQQCRLYLAESAIPNGGLGMFAGVGLPQGEQWGVDVCLYVADTPHGTHLSSHTWGHGTFFGQYEGSNSRAACEGFTTQYNTVPITAVNTKVLSPRELTNAGLDRQTSPGAGAVTQAYGVRSEAVDHIPAGFELTIDYGDWEFQEDEIASFVKPRRHPDWLKENGYCVDHIEIRPATDPQMGRGAFSTRPLRKGTVVAPAPMQIFKNRRDFTTSKSGQTEEALFVNYCLQPKNSDMLLFPYGPVVNLINHGGGKKANVFLRWSTNPMHRADWLNLGPKELFETATPGGLVLEVVALRNIQPNEEIFFDYGKDWEEAWKEHVQSWKPVLDDGYVYPADMDETEYLRTVEEQKTNPYPSNLRMFVNTPDWRRKRSNTITWSEPDHQWPENLLDCNIFERERAEHGDFLYTVEVLFEGPGYDPTLADKDRYLDFKVPRRAIRFVDKPYKGDEHLTGVFRHPLEFPDALFPQKWRS